MRLLIPIYYWGTNFGRITSYAQAHNPAHNRFEVRTKTFLERQSLGPFLECHLNPFDSTNTHSEVIDNNLGLFLLPREGPMLRIAFP